MGQVQKKYHVTDDGIIFSVMDDGSVSEIGNISSISAKQNVAGETKRNKSRKWIWIAVISWIVLIASCVTFFVKHEAASDYIFYLNNRNYEIEQALTLAQSELASKSAELDSLNQQIYNEKQKRMPISVRDVKFANETYDSQIIDNYGSTLYSNRLRFLKPKITYTGRKTGTYNLTEKIIRPDGSVLSGHTSPDNATQSFRIYSSSGINGQYEILSWGWDSPGNYEVGRWTFQIWYEDILIYSTTFDVL